MPGITPQQAQDPPGQAQYTPVASGTVANLRQTIGSGNIYRAAKAAAAPPRGAPERDQIPRQSCPGLLLRFPPNPKKAQWAVFTDGWFVAINNDKPMTFKQLRDVPGSGAGSIH
jgi:hypothetical protein